MNYRLTLESGEIIIFESESHEDAREEAVEKANEQNDTIIALENVYRNPDDGEYYLIVRLI